MKSATASEHSRWKSNLELAPLPFTCTPSLSVPHQLQLEVAGFDAARAGLVARDGLFFVAATGTTHPSAYQTAQRPRIREQTSKNTVGLGPTLISS